VTTLLNWVLYLEIYLTVGFVVCSAFIGTHLFVNRHKSTVFDYMRRSTNREWTHFLCDFFEDFFIPAVALALVWVVWPIPIGLKIKSMVFKKPPPLKPRRLVEVKEFILNEAELIREVTIEEVERTNFIHDPMEAVPNVPFGHSNALWLALRDSIQPNETLWEFESERSELKGVHSMWGYAIKGDGRVDRFMTTGWKIKIEVGSG
jgi:hypothetical protein